MHFYRLIQKIWKMCAFLSFISKYLVKMHKKHNFLPIFFTIYDKNARFSLKK